ncbi:DgyrCDS6880 [Dimorphilus gyrociliatus]|uniref:Microsomal glutathione S-transferase 1 n=1 Tax=Dimorphilus gyrociliatus TaxID=2664684 RepID=A0A7I8VPH7_9ANNE|nr:DgyrCDS6880 [Dimorphilus gyrociliatus]
MSDAIFSLGNPVFAGFAFHSVACLSKTVILGPLTTMKRFATMTFSNEEDKVVVRAIGQSPKDAKVDFRNDSVERLRRNHLNDMENVYPFVLTGFFYVMTRPSLDSALLHFRIFTISRFVHMLAYQFALPQPLRATAFSVGVGIIFSMAYKVLSTACSAL